MKSYVVFNAKGGVGKTSTAHSIAVGFARRGLRCLVVDVDPQTNLSTWLGYPAGSDVRTLLDVASDKSLNLAHCALDTEEERLQLLPSAPGLRGLQGLLAHDIAAPLWLRKKLRAVDGQWDVVVIDCGPGLDLITTMGLVAADEVISPLKPTAMSLEGVALMLGAVEQAQELNDGLTLRTIVPVLVNRQTVMAVDSLRDLRQHLGEKVSPVEVPQTVRMEEAFAYRLPIYDHSPHSPAALAYQLLVDDLLGTPPTEKALREIRSSVLDFRQADTSESAA